MNLEETLEALIEDYLERKDPVVKAERILNKKSDLAVARQPKEATWHQVNRRDKGQCTYINSQKERCFERRWIDVHHIIPKHRGGPDTLENLTTLCSGHHRLIHSQ